MEERIQSILWVQEYKEQPDRLLIYEEEYERLLHMEERKQGGVPGVVVLKGRTGSGRKFLMGHLAYVCRRRVAYVYMDALYDCFADLGQPAAELLKRFLDASGDWLCLIDEKAGETI